MLSDHFTAQFLETKDPFPSIIGQAQAKHDIMSALASRRHLILIGQPGIGKTTLAKSIAQLLPQKDGKQVFVRVQGSPDLTAEDLLGDIDPIKAMEFGPLSTEAFTPGKIFQADGGVLFFDEVNRAPQKLQNALLQVLEEGYATIGAYKVDFPADFLFIGTMNPQDTSTEQLSSVFLDRFDLVYMTHPATAQEEFTILLAKGRKLDVTCDEKIVKFIAAFMKRLRDHENLARVPSVRASLGLYERAQANAVLDKEKKVSLRHVFAAVRSVLPHRLEMKPSVKYLQSPKEFVSEQLHQFAKQQGLQDELNESDVP